MPNKNYVKGRTFEYKVKKFYEDNGYLVFRTAGSHSPADLIVFPPMGNWFVGKELGYAPMLVQCKTGKAKMTNDEKDELQTIAIKYGLRARLAENDKGTIKFTWVVKE